MAVTGINHSGYSSYSAIKLNSEEYKKQSSSTELEKKMTQYHASDEEKARLALDRVTEKWTAKYQNSVKRWYDNWDAITPIFDVCS